MTGNDRAELIEKDLIQMVPTGSGHATSVNSLTYALAMACDGNRAFNVQTSVCLNDLSEP